MKLRRNSQGSSLVELTVTIAILSIVTVVISTFTVITLEQYATTQARANMLNETQLALTVAQNDIRLAASADEQNRWEDANGPVAGDDFSWEYSDNTLILAVAVLDQDNDVIFADPAQYISEKNNVIYFVDNGTLYKRTLASPVAGNSSRTTCPEYAMTDGCGRDVALLQNVRTFNVRYLNENDQEVDPPDARSVELEVEVSKRTFNRDISVDYETRMVFRND